MPTYASPKIMKTTLLLFNSFIFVIGFSILIDGVIIAINYSANNNNAIAAENSDPSFNKQNKSESNITSVTVLDDRFPSAGSASVVIICGAIALSVSALGIIAANKEDLRLLSAYSILLFIAFFTTFLFLIATVCMHAYTIDYNPIRMTTLFSATTSLVELVLCLCACHYTKIIKRGDAITHNVLRLHDIDNNS